MIQAIFFDFNGVIIDDEPIQMAAYQALLRDYGIDLTEADYYSALGMDDKTFVRAAFARVQKDLNDELLKEILQAKIVRHRELLGSELPLFPGVVNFLKAASREFSLALVSMASLTEIEYVLQRANLTPLFSVIVSSKDVNVCKPAPDCYRAAFEKLNDQRRAERKLPLLTKECLAVEDSPPGIESGRLAGMHTLGITNTVSENDLRAAGAEIVSRNLGDWTTDAVQLLYG